MSKSEFYQIKVDTACEPIGTNGTPNINTVRNFSSLVYNDPVGSSVTISFPSELLIPGETWYIGLVDAAIFNTWQNLSATLGNNVLKYQVGAGPWKTITLPDGNYNMGALNAAVQAAIQANGDGTPQDPNVNFVDNSINNRTILELDATFKVDLTNAGLASLLGFNPQIVDGSLGTSHEGETTANFSGGVNSVEIHCDLARGSFTNGSTSKMIFSWILEGGPGELQDIFPSHQIMWFPLCTRDTIESITVSLKTNTGLPWDPKGTNWSTNLRVERR